MTDRKSDKEVAEEALGVVGGRSKIETTMSTDERIKRVETAILASRQRTFDALMERVPEVTEKNMGYAGTLTDFHKGKNSARSALIAAAKEMGLDVGKFD